MMTLLQTCSRQVRREREMSIVKLAVARWSSYRKKERIVNNSCVNAGKTKGVISKYWKGLSRFLKPQSEDGVPQLSRRFSPGRSSEVLIIVASDELCCTGSHVKPAEQDYFFCAFYHAMSHGAVRWFGLITALKIQLRSIWNTKVYFHRS